MSELNKSHDIFCKWFLSKVENFISLCEDFLPENIVSKLDMESVKQINGVFAKDDLRENYSDLLFETNVEGEKTYVYILVEHKSYDEGRQWV